MYRSYLEVVIQDLAPKRVSGIIQNPPNPGVSGYVVTLEPSKANRAGYYRTFASRAVFDMPWEKHIHSRVDIMAEFHDLFVSSHATSLGGSSKTGCANYFWRDEPSSFSPSVAAVGL